MKSIHMLLAMVPIIGLLIACGQGAKPTAKDNTWTCTQLSVAYSNSVITALAFARYHDLLVVADADGRISVYDSESNRMLWARSTGHEGSGGNSEAVFFAFQDKTVVLVSYRDITVWDVKTHELVGKYDYILNRANRLPEMNCDGSLIRIFSHTYTGDDVWIDLKGKEVQPKQWDLEPKGKWRVDWAPYDAEIILLYDEIKHNIQCWSQKEKTWVGHVITNVTPETFYWGPRTHMSSKGRRLILEPIPKEDKYEGCTTYPIPVWDTDSGKLIAALESPFDRNRRIGNIKLDIEGKFLAISHPPLYSEDEIDGKSRVGLEQETVAIWRVAPFDKQPFLAVNTGVVFDMAFSSNGRMLAVGTQQGTLNLWKLHE